MQYSNMTVALLPLLALGGVFAVGDVNAATSQPAERFFACGSNEVRLYENDKDGFRETWTWKSDAVEFQKIDECKSSDSGRTVLVTASTGGVAMVDVPTGTIKFRAFDFMAHSIELLPNGRLAVAVSVADPGNRLQIYDINTAKVLLSIPHQSLHGVIWDAKRARLYASGGDHLTIYSLKDWDTNTPLLVSEAAIELPGQKNGHDLTWRDDDNLIVTTQDSVWSFNIETQTFSPFEPLARVKDVKAVSVDQQTGRILYQQPEESWWSFHVKMLNPEDQVATPGMRLYKVRWINAR